MTPDEAQEGITPSYGHIHLSPDELAQLSPAELLQACLHYRSLVQVIVGVKKTINSPLPAHNFASSVSLN